MSPEKEALAVFWMHKRFWFFSSLAAAGWTMLALSWFWLPDSSIWGVVWSTAQGLIVIFGGLWLARMDFVFYSKAHGGSSWKAILRPRFYASLALVAAIGIYIPYKLIGWHPPFSSFAMQTASLIVRFALAYLIAVSAWLILVSLFARLGTDSAADPVRSNPAPLAPRTAQPNP